MSIPASIRFRFLAGSMVALWALCLGILIPDLTQDIQLLLQVSDPETRPYGGQQSTLIATIRKNQGPGTSEGLIHQIIREQELHISLTQMNQAELLELSEGFQVEQRNLEFEGPFKDLLMLHFILDTMPCGPRVHEAVFRQENKRSNGRTHARFLISSIKFNDHEKQRNPT